MTDVRRGDSLLMSCSLARRTAAMIDAAITSVEANRSVMRFCSSITFARSCSSRAMARLISPIFHRHSWIRRLAASLEIAGPERRLPVNTGAPLHGAGVWRLHKSPVESRREPACLPGSLCRQLRTGGCRSWGRETWDQYRRIQSECLHNLSMPPRGLTEFSSDPGREP